MKMTRKLLAVVCACSILYGCASAAESTEDGETGNVPAAEETADTADVAEDASDKEAVEVTPDEAVVTEETLSADRSIIQASVPALSLSGGLLEEAEEQTISILLPPGYDAGTEVYPVMYYLPGFGYGAEDHLQVFEQFLEGLPADDPANRIIYVAANGKNRNGGTFYANSPVTGNWQDYITQDVVGFMDANYRTVAEQDSRALVGHCMGGNGAAAIALDTSGIFGHIYLLSPGIYDENNLAELPIAFDAIAELAGSVKDLSAEEAHAAYLTYTETISWPADFAFSGGSAFAPDLTGQAPYILIPEKTEDGSYAEDEAMAMYHSGFGNWAARVYDGSGNLAALSSFRIDCGDAEPMTWIIGGCESLATALEDNGIPHELVMIPGADHAEYLVDYIGSDVIPYITDCLSK